MRLAVVIGLLIGLLAGPAPAADLLQAQALYSAGEMRAAAALARRLGTADAYALAARASLVEAVYQADPGDRAALLVRALEDAARALEIDPVNVDALIERALALGHLTEGDLVGAQANGYAPEGRKLIELALELAPDNPWAHGLLGMWHLQVVRHAGPALGSSLYGANEQEGLAACARALGIAPDDPALRFGCALSRLQADPQRFGWSTLRELSRVIRLPARDAAERLVQAEAGRIARDLSRRLRD